MFAVLLLLRSHAHRNMLRSLGWLSTGLLFLLVWGSCSNETESATELPHQFGIDLGPADRDAYGVLPADVAGWRVTRGAAPGYVDDKACKDCHEDVFNSYQEMGMARSFYPAEPSRSIEKLGETFHQEVTGFYYEMFVRDGRLWQKRYCQDDAGKRFAEHEVAVSWIIGSGNHVRSYFSQNARGELYQLPLSWYAEDGWAMSPGYDRKEHSRFERLVEQRCMFCHNAYAELPRGGDAPMRPPVFPKQLPHGIGCQRCHGPGARHVEAAANEGSTDEQIRARILNPARFDARKKEEVCLACHLQPDVNSSADSIGTILDRPMYSHRPDSDLMEFVAYFDFGTEAERLAKIEVNHHGHRMRKSRCYTESAGRFTCVSCHDPHRKIQPADQAAHYRKKCLECHGVDACKLQGMGTTVDPGSADCVHCHMVKARPRDVVHVTVTDHYVRRRPPETDLTAPRPESGVVTEGTLEPVPLYPDRLPAEPYRTIYAAQACDKRITQERLSKWREALARAQNAPPAYFLRFAQTLIQLKIPAEAVEVLRGAVDRFPEHSDLLWNLGLVLHLVDRHEEALPFVEKSLRKEENPRVRRLLGNLLARTGDLPRALLEYEKSLKGQPESSRTWKPYAFTLAQLGRVDDAIAAFEKVIALDPDHENGYELLADLYKRRGQPDKTIEVLGFGASRSAAVGQQLSVELLMGPPATRDPRRSLVEARRAVSRDVENGRSHLCVAIAIVLGGAPEDAGPALDSARRLGADPACCSAVAVLDSLRRRDTAAATRHYGQMQQEMRSPSRESLRGPLGQLVQSAAGQQR